ncbi:MAG: PD-(D/E)XK nuclease family protein [Oscillospiraceae bacterium]|nr:PD-(D/E)XK nuclease family protein [Oscillospiraceae bacterium]
MKGMVLLVPDQFSHEAERLLSESCGDAISLHAEVLSFSRLCNRVFSEYGGIARTYLDEGGKVVTMQLALQMAEDQISSFGRKNRQTEYILSLLDTAAECRSAGITPDALRKSATRASGHLRSKVNDTAYVLEIYQGRMTQDLQDPDEKLDRLARQLPLCGYAQGRSLWVDGFRDFTAQQYRVLEQLLAACQEMTITLTLDPEEEESSVFANARKTRDRLLELAACLGQETNIRILQRIGIDNSPEMNHLEANPFADCPTCCEERENIHILHCGSAAEEWEAVAAAVLDLAEKGIRYQDMAVAVGGFEGQEYFGRSILEAYGIPVYVNQKTDILQMPAVAALQGALQILCRGWDYESVFSYLKTGYSGLSEEECDSLENYALTWNIRGSMWFDADWNMDPEGYKDPEHSDSRRPLLEQLNSWRRKAVTPLYHLSKAMKMAENGGERIKALFAFADEINLYEGLEQEASRLAAIGEERAGDDCLSLGTALTKAAEQYFLIAGDLTCSLPEFASQWQLLLSRCRIGTIPSYVDHLTLGDLGRIRRRGLKYLFVMGMTQNRLPALDEPRGVFSVREREELRNLQLPLAKSQEERLCASLAEAYDLLTLPSEGLFLSCVPGNGEVPSQLMDTIRDMFSLEVEMPSLVKNKTAAIRPCLELALSGASGAEANAARLVLVENGLYKALQEKAGAATSSARLQLSDEAVKSLYPSRLSLTASRVNTYRGCPFQYYMEYGLRVKKREEAQLTPSVIGTLIHYVLEKTAGDVKQKGGFSKVTGEECCRIAQGHIEYYEQNYLNLTKEAGRLRFLFDVVAADTLAIVRDMAAELSESDFEPYSFELRFPDRQNGSLPYYSLQDGERELDVGGIVDRVDGWEKDGSLYLRVVDYKTGNKDFKLSEVYHGFDMQMLIYLFALKRFGGEYYGKPVKPAGILYTPAKNKYYTVKDDDNEAKIQKNQANQHKRTGLILQEESVIEAMEHGREADKGKEYPFLGLKCKDGLYSGSNLITEGQLELLNRHVDRRLMETCRGILSGSIGPQRIHHHEQESCRYCPAVRICRPEKRVVRYLPPYEGSELWTKLAEKEEDFGTAEINTSAEAGR